MSERFYKCCNFRIRVIVFYPHCYFYGIKVYSVHINHYGDKRQNKRYYYTARVADNLFYFFFYKCKKCFHCIFSLSLSLISVIKVSSIFGSFPLSDDGLCDGFNPIALRLSSSGVPVAIVSPL